MRKSGILMHITSLPSPYGIGTMGKEARAFVDFLEKAGQSCWQVLPLGQTGYGDSPYQSCSLYAGNPYLIDLDTLVDEGYLTREEIEAVTWGDDPEKVDFGLLYERRYPLFRKAFARFRENIPEDYDAFGWEQGQWLEDYALYMAIKTEAGGVAWDKWDEPLRRRDPAAIAEAKMKLGMEMFFWKMLQYFFFRQWQDLKDYAHEKGIMIIGDTPIYAAYDSADVWAQPWLFSLDEEGKQVEVAGCPPDAFSRDGQLWGNPVFRWDVMQKDGYDWWIRRLRHNLKIYDVLRIDHFRGFDSYYCIPAGNKNARIGWWRQGPGMDFFRKVQQVLGKNLPLIAEDLGDITPSVQAMLAESGYPGMKVLQFAFGGGAGNEYLPQNHRENAVVYTGTHDNTTNLGWWKQISRKEKTVMRDRLHLDKNADPNWSLMQAAMESVCDTAILTMQDLLELGGEARMNTPSTAGGNWAWRAKKGYLTKKLAGQLHRMTERANRLPGFDGEEASWAFQTALGDKLPGWEKRLPAEEAEDPEEEQTSVSKSEQISADPDISSNE